MRGDVFKELGGARVSALVGLLTATPKVNTTAGTIPDGVEDGKVVHLAGGVFS
ncbi:MAG: hypothetical protein H8D48_04100 [Actinobacteria bacterium]|nr:hypothetical protein [Actinomycetota bacterium]